MLWVRANYPEVFSPFDHLTLCANFLYRRLYFHLNWRNKTIQQKNKDMPLFFNVF